MSKAYLSLTKTLNGGHIVNLGEFMGALPMEKGTHKGEDYFNKIARASRELYPDSIGMHSVKVLFNPSAKGEPVQFHAVPFRFKR